MAQALPLRIFIASPGDLATERKLIEQCVREHNARALTTASATFETVGWESVRGTARRPQEAINELIGECHYLVALFKEIWGSEPGSPWGYTSGTEEELFSALLHLGEIDRPMRDVWVAYMHSSNPAPQILDLRDQMSTRHAVMYETLNDAVELKQKFSERLSGWSTTTRKSPRHIALLPSSGKDVLRAASLCHDGQKLIELGHPDQGRYKLQEAAAIGGPTEKLAYARILARQGQLDLSEKVIETAIEHFTTGSAPLSSALAAEAFAAQAGLLRRQGRHRDAIGRLEQALTLFDVAEPSGQTVRARILDELGLAYQKVGEPELARERMVSSLETREQVGDHVEVAQSLVNIARLDVQAKDLESALRRADDALVRLRDIPPSVLHANAHVLRAQVLLRRGEAKLAIESALRSVALNEQFQNLRGLAIAHYVAAQCFRSAADFDSATRHAKDSLELNGSMGNDRGQEKAQWLLDNMSG